MNVYGRSLLGGSPANFPFAIWLAGWPAGWLVDCQLNVLQAKQLRESLEQERAAAARRAEEDAAALERYRAETSSKMRLLEESLRLQVC